MPAPRVFTEQELLLAKEMRAAGDSWRAVGRALVCNEDTIRAALDGQFLRNRHDAIVEARRRKRAA